MNHDIYYTKHHEWIAFRGTVAYTGICASGLSGFKAVHQVLFINPFGFKRQGEVIAIIKYNHCEVEVHMPVDGKLLRVNEPLTKGQENLLLQPPGANTWIAMINPSRPYERKELLLPRQYQLNGKSKYAK